MKKGMKTTIDLVPWDSIGKAKPDDLYELSDAVKAAAAQDKDIEDFEVTITKDKRGKPSFLVVAVTGKTRADVLVERAIDSSKLGAKELTILPIRGEKRGTE
jgi:hypothetical protein